MPLPFVAFRPVKQQHMTLHRYSLHMSQSQAKVTSKMGHPSLTFVCRYVGCSVVSSEPLMSLLRMLLCSMRRHSAIDIDSFLRMHLDGHHRDLSKHVRAA
jgi:hypothetical protein